MDTLANTEPDTTPIKITVEVRQLNRKELGINPAVIDENYLKRFYNCEPRPEKILVKHERPRTPWIFPVSIWATYGYNYDDETEEFMDECFEHDFNRCNFIKDCKTESVHEELHDYLKKHYKLM